jgi:hypothetical protein
VDACQLWLRSLLANGWNVYVPEIADYEVRRELIRANQTAGLNRLDALLPQLDYLPITTAVMRLAADLWAKARNAGWATATPQALDGDVILAAQVLTLALPPADVIVATMNVAHLTGFLAADTWQNIIP